jgi:hypothetical protein
MPHGEAKELILHIGRSKSGTSTLQHYLTRNREQLAAQGVCYPKTGCEGRVAQHGIALACRHLLPCRRSLRELRAAFQAEVQPFDRIIVSSEAFQTILWTHNLNFFFGAPSAKRWWTVPQTQRQYHIRAICYVREFLEFACSSYAQNVQSSNESRDFTSYCSWRFRRPLSWFVRFWQRFSEDAVFVYYDRQRLFHQDIVDDFFLHQIALTPPSPSTSNDVNPSISGNLLAFKLLLNRHGHHYSKLYGTFAELAGDDVRFRGRFFVSDTQAQVLRSRFSHHNAQLVQLVGDIQEKSFESGNRFDPIMWKEDVERFLAHPDLGHLKNRPEIYRASAESAGVLLNR